MEHISINRVEINDTIRRKGGAPRYTIPKRTFSEHGEFLNKDILENISIAEKTAKKFLFNPYLVMKIELEPKIKFTEKEKEKLNLYNLRLIDEESSTIQVAFSEDLELKGFMDDLNKYRDSVKARTKVINQDLFGKIKEVLPWSANDRRCFDDSKSITYLDVYLWVFDTLEESRYRMNEFLNDLRKNEILVTDKYIGHSVVICRVKIQKEEDKEVILNHPYVYKAEDIQTINIISNEIEKIKNISIGEVKFNNSNLDGYKSQSICVIDSGIFQQHPLFAGVIGDSKTFYIDETSSKDDSNDYSGHGTKVASVCEYGDFKYNQEFIPKIYLFNAKIHNGEYTDPLSLFRIELEEKIGKLNMQLIDAYLLLEENRIDITQFSEYFPVDERPFVRMLYSKYSNMYEKLIPNQMKEIVEYFNGEYGCRIFNLCQGDSNYVYNNEKPKAWTCVLDELQNENDILFVISAGNYNYENSEIDDVVREYPKYFFEKGECKIIEPANSVNSVTVGAMAINDQTIKVNVGTQLNSIESITSKNSLSTFSRIGPGVNNSIKPDFVAYGGDFAIKQNILGKKVKAKNAGISKLLFGKDLENIFDYDIGTSFAAPYISHIAAKILERYPNISNNMIRCLLANSSKYTPEIEKQINDVKQEADQVRREFQHNNKGQWINNNNKMLYYSYGYGFPMINECLDSQNNNVVLMADMNRIEDKISPNQVHIFRIPMTEEFINSEGIKKVKVTLAFNPKVRNTRIDYLGSTMDFKIIRGKSQEEIYKMFIRNKKGENLVDLEGECDTNPSTQLRSKGTLQKGVYQFKKSKNFNNEDIFVAVSCKKQWDDSPQSYSLVVGLQTEADINIYNTIRAKVDIREKIRV